jgi:glycine dehydrogenase subunit 1
VSRYTPTTDADRAAMLEAIGVREIDELFADIPARLRLTGELALGEGRCEQEVYEELRALAARNVSAEQEISFLGAGMYDHYVPALIDSITQRSEFLTPYTPYQPEVSQGTLQAMFEYQTAISELTGLPVANASVYEGPSAVAAAGYLARQARGGRRFVVSRGVHPHAREALATLAHAWEMEVQEVGLSDGATVLGELSGDVCALVVAQPNFLGAAEDLEALCGAAHAAGALVICSCDPIALSLVRTPGECGVDIAVGEGQPLGGRLDFGGPSFGFFAATEALLRRMPGRIAGQAQDLDGRRGFVLTLQTREQHIRRERATSNICTAQALNALAGVIYLSWLGARGFVELGELLLARTAYARERLGSCEGISLLHERPVVREFALALDAPVARVVERCQAQGVNPGYALAREYPEYPDGLLVAITERRSRADIDRLVEVLGRAVAAERTAASGGRGRAAVGS